MATKEGGWGWVVTVAAFVVHVITCGVTVSAGAFHLFFMDLFGKNQAMTSLLTTSVFALSALSAIPGFYLSYLIGYRLTAILGGLLAGLSCGLALLVEEYYQALIASVGVGVGFGLATTASLIAISSYFYTKHAAVVSAVSVGGTVGAGVMPVTLFYTYDNYGWKGACAVLASLGVLMSICGSVMRPHSKSSGRDARLLKIFDTTLLKCASFWAFLFISLIWNAGASIVYVHLPNFMNETGTDRPESVVLLSGIGAAHFVSRAMFLVFSHNENFDHVTTFICTIGLSTILTGLFKELFKTYAGKIGYVMIFGLHVGFWDTFVNNLADDVIGMHFMERGRGYLAIFACVGFAGGAPLVGWLRDSEGNYEVALYLAGALFLGASLIVMATSARHCYYIPPGYPPPEPSSEPLSNNVQPDLDDQVVFTSSSYHLAFSSSAGSSRIGKRISCSPIGEAD